MSGENSWKNNPNQYKIPDLHHNLFAFKKNTGTSDNTAALRSVLD